MARAERRPVRAVVPADRFERAARGVAALRERRRNGASGPTGLARPGAGLERDEILRGRALAGLVIAPGSEPASRLAAGLGDVRAVHEAYRAFALESIAAGIRALTQPPPAGRQDEDATLEQATIARAAGPGEPITTVLRVANRSYRLVTAAPQVTRWYDLESGSPVDGFETVFEGERRFEPSSDALWRLSVRTPDDVSGARVCVAAITFGPGLVPSIRMEVRTDAARRRTARAAPSPS
jgi:hypothetical protein